MPIVAVPRATVPLEGHAVRRLLAVPAAGRGRVAWAAMAVCVLALLGASLPARAQSISFAGVQTTVPASGLHFPDGVAVDGAGDVFIADSGHNRVVKLPAGCTNTTCQTTMGSGVVSSFGVAVDGAGDVFLSDPVNSRVVEVPAGCTSAACQTTVGSGLISPEGVAVDGAGDAFIADVGSVQVVKVPSGCASAACQITVGSGFREPTGVAVDGAGDVFIADVDKSWVVEVPSGCTSAACQTTVGSGFNDPTGVAVDGAGDLFIADNGASRVVEVPAEGGAQITVGSGLNFPNGVAVDGAGDLFIADSGNSRVVEVQTRSVNFGSANVGAGTSLTLNYNIDSSVTVSAVNVVTQGAPNLDFTLSSTTCTGSQAAGSTCTVTVSFAPRAPGVRLGAVELTSSSGSVLATTLLHGIGQGPAIAFDPGVQTTMGSGLQYPQAVAVDAAGDVFIADTGNSRVVEVPAGGGAQTTVGSELSLPQRVAVDGAGDVFIADTNNSRVVEVPAGGGAQITVGSGLQNPHGVTVDGAGDVYIADTSNLRVVEIPAGGGAQTTVGSGLAGPEDVAVDGAGDVFIADTYNSRVVEVPAGGGAQTTVGSGLSYPQGVAVDAAGDVFIADSDHGRIVEVPAGGGAQTTVTTGTLYSDGVAVDGAGDIYIADFYNDRVLELQRSLPPSLSFASTQLGQTSSDSPQSVQIQDVGNLPLTALTPGLVIGANFDQVPGDGTPEDCSSSFSLTSGQLCNLSISFEPQSSGTLTSTAVFTDNALNRNPATQTITLSGTGTESSQTITFTLPNPVHALTSAALPADSSAGLPVTYTPSTPTVCSVSGNVAQFLTSGTCTIVATQTGNANYSAAPQVTQSTTVTLASQTITFTALGTQTAGTTANLSANSSSNGTITFGSSTPSVCTVSGSKASFLTGGTCTLTASVPANNIYAAATTSQSLTVIQKTQTITFSALPSSDLQGTVLTLTATATSGLPVSFTSLTPTLCSVSGSTATLLQAGTCTIQASQSGNATYAAAASVSKNVTVIAAFTITPTPSRETIYRGDVAAFLLELKAASGFTGKVTLSCSGGPSGSYCADFPLTVSFNKGIALAISGVFFPAATTPGTYTLTFTGASGSIVDNASATFIVEAKP